MTRIAWDRNLARTLGHYWRALRHEWRRILAWRRRYNPETQRTYGTLEAWAAVIENPPGLDTAWDDIEWSDAGSQEEIALYEPERRCRECGCTDDAACLVPFEGPCRWVESDLCSACVEVPA